MTINEKIISRLCNNNNRFTGGDNKANAKLLELAKNSIPTGIISQCIWLVSDDTYVNIYNTIKKSGYTGK